MRRIGEAAAGSVVLCALAAACLRLAYADGRADALQARDWAASCMTCHGPLPQGAASPMPTLTGRPAAEIVAAMRDFRSGARASTVMHQISMGYSDAESARIAAYLAAYSAANPAKGAP